MNFFQWSSPPPQSRFCGISSVDESTELGYCVNGASAFVCEDTPQKSTKLCKRCEARGFTLLELLAVMVIITAVATATFSGLNTHTFDSAHRRFLDDVYGLVVQARNRAIEDQTEVVIRVAPKFIAMRIVDSITHVESEYIRYDLSLLYGKSLDTKVCFFGVFAGVTAPGMSSPVATNPTSCMSASQDFTFMPDGTFTFSNLVGPGQGITVVSADTRISVKPKYSLIELFPGGAMRRIDNIVVTD